jgi:hypothetical protein
LRPQRHRPERSPGKLLINATSVAAAAAALAALAGCGATAPTTASESADTTVAAGGYATTPTSSRPINPAAIPLGDGYRSTTPKVGYVDSCGVGGGGGATKVGPWIDEKSHTWDSLTKLAVEGSVRWPNASFSITRAGAKRIIKTNDLPKGHTCGVFPIASTDPAHEYDMNPNHIAAQSIDWKITADPKLAAKQTCTGGGAIGVLMDGVVLFNALDGQGRDAGAHEILDKYQGHPDAGDTYHHHEVPTFMIDAAHGRSTLVGYALDGFGIYVERNAKGELLTNTELDACHGRTSRVMWNGRMTDIYHYVATIEYPYTVGCFRGTPISSGVTMKMGGTGGPPPGM